MKRHPEDHIENLLSDRLSDFEAPVSSSQWESIKDTLDHKKKRPKILFYILGFILLSGLCVFSYSYLNKARLSSDYKTLPKSKVLTSGENASAPLNNAKQNRTTLNIPSKDISSLSQKETVKRELTFNKKDPGQSINNEIINRKETNIIRREQVMNHSLTVSVENAKPLPFIDNAFNDIYESGLEFKMPLMNPVKIQESTHQKSPDAPGFNTPFAISVFISSVYNSLKTDEKSGSQDKVHEDYPTSIGNPAFSGPGFSAGFKVEYNTRNNFSVKTGVSFLDLSQSVRYNYTISRIPVIDSATHKILGYIQLPSSQHINYSGLNIYSFVSIPLEISYGSELPGKFFWRATLGSDLMLLTSAKGETVRPDNLQLQNLATNTDLSKSGLDLSVSAGLGLHISRNIDLELLPQYHQSITSLYNTASSITGKEWSAGVEIGLKYKIQGKQ